MTYSELAIFGGEPYRLSSFEISPLVDQNELNRVVNCISEGNFSRYIGSYSPDIDEILSAKSIDAQKYNAKWHFLGGPEVRGFASDFARKFGVDYAIPVNSATSGLSTALGACDINPGDEVIVPALSYTASATSILTFNAVPVFADVDPHSFCIDPLDIEKKITSRTRAILLVHLLGNVCEMDQIMHLSQKYNLRVIEDVAQAPGAKYKNQYVGTIGDAGVFSFQQSKNMMTGEGGMIITNSSDVARKCRLISNHGEVVMQDHNTDDELVNVIGFNFRMPELCAALGRAQLAKLDDINKRRNSNAQYLVDKLRHIDGLIPPFVDKLNVDWVCHILSFLFDESKIGLPRSLFLACLRAEGIPVGTGYVRPMYENPMFLRKIAFGNSGHPWSTIKSSSKLTYSKGQAPVTHELINSKFVWFYQIANPSSHKDMDDIAGAIEKVISNKNQILLKKDLILNKANMTLTQGRI